MNKSKNWQKPQIETLQLELLEKFSNACGVSGDESEIRQMVINEIKHSADRFEIDILGSVIAYKDGKGKDLPTVLIAAHMDEIGFIVYTDDKDGIYGFEKLGGIDDRQLAGKPIQIGKDKIFGVIGAKPIHLTTPAERKIPMPYDQLKIDIGPAAAKKPKRGDCATFATKFKRVGDSLMGKAFDNRVGVTTLIEILKNAPDNINLVAAFTVQEEVGLRGAGVVAEKINPDIALAIDCTPAYDMPIWDDSENEQYNTKLDAGPALYSADGRTLTDPRLIKLFKEVGDSYDIQYQMRQPGGGGTDAGAMHRRAGGIASMSISVPGRYLHTAASIIRIADWENYYALILTALSHIDNELLATPR